MSDMVYAFVFAIIEHDMFVLEYVVFIMCCVESNEIHCWKIYIL